MQPGASPARATRGETRVFPFDLTRATRYRSLKPMNTPAKDSTSIPSPALLTVRLGALAANYREVLRRAAPSAAAPVVKANAYGMGIGPVVHALQTAGADSFFVARLQEGIEARALAPAARIFVLDGVAPGTAPALEAHRLTPVLNSLDEIAEWSGRARSER